MKHALLALAIVFPVFFASTQLQLNGLSFDGSDDYVACTLPAVFNDLANNDFTFETWVKIQSNGPGRIFYAQKDGSNFATLLLSGSNLLFYVKVSNITYTSSIIIPPLGQWTHIAATWDASVQLPLIYVNGVLQTGSSGGASSFGTNNTMTLGSRTDGAQLFSGEMDEVRIWNSARKECEIRSMMNSVPAGNETDLIHHYSFNRGTAAGNNPSFTFLPDLAGSNPGTLMNFALNGTSSNWVSSGAVLTAIGSQNAYETSDMAAICEGDSYVFGTQNLTTTGVYEETFTSIEGCDSLVTLQLTVYAAHMPPIVQQACTSYFWAQTGETYFASGLYSDTLTNSYGCDSILTLDLTIGQHTSSSVQAEACESYTWSLTGETYTVSGLYNDTIPNTSGCDSVITLDLTILEPSASTSSVSACSAYQWLQTGITYTASGLYYDTIPNAAGCDSVVTLDLSITQPTTSTVTAAACESYYWEQTGLTYAFSGSYHDTIPNAAGCDSIITLDLTITQPTSSIVTATACGSYYWEQTGQTYSFSGFYYDTIPNAAGCDSIVLLTLIINEVPQGTVTHDGNGTLTVNTSGEVAGWIDCTTGQLIPGQPGTSFTPAVNGSYAAIIENTVTLCRDTSACFNVDFLTVDEHTHIDLSIAPNPAHDQVTVRFEGARANLIILDAQGKQVAAQTIVNGEQVPLSTLESGVYLFRLQTGSGTGVGRVVKH